MLMGAFAILSKTLRTDHPESVRRWALMLGAHFVWSPVGDLFESVRTGTGGFRRLYGEPFFEWAKSHPEHAAVFHAAKLARSFQAPFEKALRASSG